jgi:hypothetical protein
MASWREFEQASPDLAKFAFDRLNGAVAYLATVRRNGSPRVHPVTPIIGQGRFFLFMEPTSPKGFDLRNNGRYAMHSSVANTRGGLGECFITGRGIAIEDDATRRIAAEVSSYTPAERYVLFELTVESIVTTVYDEGRPVRNRWNEG